MMAHAGLCEGNFQEYGWKNTENVCAVQMFLQMSLASILSKIILSVGAIPLIFAST